MKLVVAAFFAGVVVGMLYGAVRMAPPEMTYGASTVEGVVVGEVRTTAGGAVRFDVRDESREGNIRIFAPRGTQISSGMSISAEGTLEKPEPFDEFNYPRYLAGQGVYATMRTYDVEITATASFGLIQGLSSIREKAHSVLLRLVHGPAQEIAGAMTLGYGSLISEQTGEVLSRAGIRHITAISGMHIMLLVMVLLGMFLYAGLSRRSGIIFALGIIALFILLVGAPSSALRAGITGGILFAGQIGGRPLNSLRLLLYVAVLMLIWNPHLLFSDVGFQLSFSAILGIILLSGNIAGRLSFIAWESVRQVGAMSIAATLFTFPLTLFYFGVGSLGGLVINLIFLPFIGPLLILIFLSIMVGYLHIYLGMLVFTPAKLFLDTMYWLGERVSAIPFSVVSVEPGSMVMLIVGYAFVGLITRYILSRGRRQVPSFMLYEK